MNIYVHTDHNFIVNGELFQASSFIESGKLCSIRCKACQQTIDTWYLRINEINLELSTARYSDVLRGVESSF